MFKPGTPKPKTSGRKKGTKNKNTAVLERLETLGVDLIYEVLTEIRNIKNPEKKADCYLRLMEYAYPKLKAIEESISIDDDLSREAQFQKDKETVEKLRQDNI